MLDTVTVRARAVAETAAVRSPRPGVIARLGLGGMVLLAGIHKLLAPAAWTLYVVDWLEPWIVLSPVDFMLVNGWLEIGFGLALLLNRYAAFSALVAAVSLSATVVYLALITATQGGLFADVLVRDVGLAGLAWAVVVGELRAG